METCECGCGETPKGSHSRFMPGHDARLKERNPVPRHKRRDTDEVARMREYRKKWEATHPEWLLVKNKKFTNSLWRLYRMRWREWEDLWVWQGGRCLICWETMAKPQVDHCHKSDAVRGLLCHRCNMGLGCFDDDPVKLQSAINFLEALKGKATKMVFELAGVSHS